MKIRRRDVIVGGALAPIAARGQLTLTGAGLPTPNGPSLDQNFLLGTLPAAVNFTRPSSGTAFNGAGTLTSYATNVARFDYNPNTLAALGLLIEEQRTNYFLYSNAPNSWIGPQGGVTVTQNATTSPDGATDASSFAISAGASTGYYYGQYLTSNTGYYTGSIWLKGTSGVVGIRIANDAGTTFAFLGVTLTSTWQRVSVTVAFLSNPIAVQFGIDNRALAGGDTAAKTVQVFGAQIEFGAFPTSYIPTTSATATRAADVATLPVSSFAFNASAGSWAAQFINEYVPSSTNPGSSEANQLQIFRRCLLQALANQAQMTPVRR